MRTAHASPAPPAPDAVGAELVMARAALKVGLAMAVISIALVAPLRGWASALTALGAVSIVVGSFYATGRSLAWAARISLPVLHGVALGGLLLRLVLYGGLLVALRPVDVVDGPVLALTVVIATVILLTYETRFVLRTSQLWWLDDRVPVGAPAVHAASTSEGALGHGKERP